MELEELNIGNLVVIGGLEYIFMFQGMCYEWYEELDGLYIAKIKSIRRHKIDCLNQVFISFNYIGFLGDFKTIEAELPLQYLERLASVDEIKHYEQLLEKYDKDLCHT